MFEILDLDYYLTTGGFMQFNLHKNLRSHSIISAGLQYIKRLKLLTQIIYKLSKKTFRLYML